MITLSTLRPLTERLREIRNLSAASSVLSWDMETHMPSGGGEARAEVLAVLEGAAHEAFTSPRMEALLDRWIDPETEALRDPEGADEKASAFLREVRRDFKRAKALPTEFVSRLKRTCARAQQAWVSARENDDFPLFLPHLSAVVALKREEAEYLDTGGTPYDALMDEFEPGAASAEITPLFEGLKVHIAGLLSRIGASSFRPAPLPGGPFDARAQLDFGRRLLAEIGYSFEHGRLDESAHPFTSGFHPTDVRVTTRIDPADPLSSVFSCLHEGGHALYDQGLDPVHYGTPLGEPVSLGLHESQSRLWENFVGRSLAFWRRFYPVLQEIFPAALGSFPLEAFYAAVNEVKPSLIRVEADELTYNLHVMVRYDLERALIAGDLFPADLPEAWNAAMEAALGIRPSNDREGVLQDIHWAHGAFGYFPTYALGNLYAAQFWRQVRREIPDLDLLIARGEFLPLREWLGRRIHLLGRTYTAGDLIRRVTGETLDPSHFVAHLEEKLGRIYGLT